MNRTLAATQHGHLVSRVAGVCPVPAVSASVLVPSSSLPLVDAAQPQHTRTESAIQWLGGMGNLFAEKREQRTAIT